MLNFYNFYRDLGIVKIKDMIEPKIVKVDELAYPNDSILYYFKPVGIVEGPSREDGYLKNIKKSYVLTATEYLGDELLGNFKYHHSEVNGALRLTSKKEKRYKFIKPNSGKLRITDKDLLIMNYGILNSVYRYSSDPLNLWYKWYNPFSTMVKQLDGKYVKSNRDKIVLIDIPSVLPDRLLLDRYVKHITSSDMKTLLNYKYFNLVEFWRYLTPETRKSSLLGKINREDMDKITFMFYIDNKVIFMKFSILAGMVKEYGYESRISKYSADVVKKILYVMLYKMSIHSGYDVSSIVSGVTDMDKSDKDLEGELNIDDYLKTETLDKKDETIGDSGEDDIKEEELVDIISGSESERLMSKVEGKVYNTLEDIEKEDISSEDKLEEEIKTIRENGMMTKKEYERLNKVLELQKKQPLPYKGMKMTIGEALDPSKDKLTISKEDKTLEDNVVVFDKTQNNAPIEAISKEYLENQYKKDLTRTIFSIQNANTIIEEYTVEEKESILGGEEEHSVKIKMLDGKSSTIKIKLPKIYPDGTFKLSGNAYNMALQKADLPIRKLNHNRVGLTTYYGKYFISKAARSQSDVGNWFAKQLVAKYDEDPKLKNIVLIPVISHSIKVPNDYGMVSRMIKSFTYKGNEYFFEYKKRKTIYSGELKPIEGKEYVLTGVTKDKLPIVMSIRDNKLYIYKNKKYELLSNSLIELLGFDISKKPVEYTTIKIYKMNIPTSVLLGYYLGITTLLKVLKVKYDVYKPRERVTVDESKYTLTFKDVKIVITKDNDKADLILGGYLSINKHLKSINYDSLNKRDTYTILFNVLGLKLLYVNEIKMLENMFVDPMAKAMLKSNNLPVTFKGLLIKSNEMLSDDNYEDPYDVHGMAFKGYERVAGMVYNEMVKSMKEYQNKSHFSRAKFNMDPYKIIRDISEDSTTIPIDNLNPIAMLKQRENTTLIGSGGRSKGAIQKEAIMFNESEVGILSEASKDSGDVGVSAYMSAAPVFDNIRGKPGKFNFKEDGWTSVLSTSALLAPFSIKDDIKRIE